MTDNSSQPSKAAPAEALSSPGNDEPVAWVVFADNGNVRLWGKDRAGPQAFADENGSVCEPVYRRPAQGVTDHDERRLKADYRMGWWMAAALEDPKVSAEMKAVINEWFEAHQPGLDLHASTIGALSLPSTMRATPEGDGK